MNNNVADLDKQTDYDIIKSVLDGNVNDFEALVTKYEKRLYNVVYRICKNEEDAQDVLQDAFVKIYTGLHKFREESSFYTYAYRVASNTAIDFVRKAAKSNNTESIYKEGEGGEYTLEIADERPSPEEETLNNELSRELFAAINSLQTDHREALVLRDVDGLSYDEISDILGITLGTVKSRINRARQALKKDLVEKGNFFEKFMTKK